MNAIDVANQYFDAWNRHDPDALADVFAPSGTYRDPTTAGELTGAAITANATSLWAAFPDLSFEIISAAEARPGVIAAEWIMRGTNAGEFLGLPATRKTVTLPGADFITVENDRVRAVTGYFDTRAIPEQLGLQVVVQPYALGPFSFGVSTSVQSGSKAKPGAFSVTQLMSLSDESMQEIRQMSRETAGEMMKMKGFIGLVTARIGERAITISAWERPDDSRQLMRSEAHGAAMQRFFAGASASSAYTSVWAPARINTLWVRCNACLKMNNADTSAGVCACGERLPEPAPYW
ncbi:MAG: ester cyclase [Gammaproteobacteria bacterium]